MQAKLYFVPGINHWIDVEVDGILCTGFARVSNNRSRITLYMEGIDDIYSNPPSNWNTVRHPHSAQLDWAVPIHLLVTLELETKQSLHEALHYYSHKDTLRTLYPELFI